MALNSACCGLIHVFHNSYMSMLSANVNASDMDGGNKFFRSGKMDSNPILSLMAHQSKVMLGLTILRR